MMISFSTVRLARMTSAMVEVCVIVVFDPVARVIDCAGASDALSSTSPVASAGSTPSSTWISPAATAPAAKVERGDENAQRRLGLTTGMNAWTAPKVAWPRQTRQA